MPSLFAIETAVGYARVAVERGVDRYPDGLTYAIPLALAGLRPGERVIVPLGRGDSLTPGYVIDVSDADGGAPAGLDPEQLKPIERRDRDGLALPEQLLALGRWISSYYCTPIGMTLATMMPAAVKRKIGSVSRTMIDLGDPLPLDEKLPAKQRQVLEALAKLPPGERPVEVRALAALAGVQTLGPIRKLIERGLLDVSRRTAVEAQWADQAVDARAPASLTEDQRRAIEEIGGTLDAGFSTHLLYGVTGSGKTEVYIRLIERVLGRRAGAPGLRVLVLVPEISLTPQTGGRLIGRFPKHRVAVLHSGLTAAQRHQQWALAADESSAGADIVLGARSAVFAPIPDGMLGLIIVDEEHDGSYKQDQAPRYHGRDVAIRRAQLAGCPIVLGSATPSLESWHNAHQGIEASRPQVEDPPRRGIKSAAPYHLHRLPHRVPGMRLPKVQVVDFREQAKLRKDKRVHLIGPALEEAIGRTLDQNGQVLLLLNRRGYASYIACPSSHCGWVMTCDHCDVTVVYHLDKKLPAGGYVRCHHCLSEQKLPPACPDCNSRLSTFGLGTQRVEEELARTFPQLEDGRTLLRMDSDTMHGSRQYHDALRRFGEGEIKLLLGTQMIAKGLDFPNVRLVGVINADTSINLPDFRASERTFQLVNQVAGRCGRSVDPGLTIVQTFNAGAPAIRFAAAHDYESFARLELAERLQSGLPPITRMVRFVVRDEDHVACVTAAKKLADGLAAIVGRVKASSGGGVIPSMPGCLDASMPSHESIRLRGPAPCPIARIADKHRQQVELIAPTAGLIQQVLAEARTAGLIRAGADLAVDVDPTSLL